MCQFLLNTFCSHFITRDWIFKGQYVGIMNLVFVTAKRFVLLGQFKRSWTFYKITGYPQSLNKLSAFVHQKRPELGKIGAQTCHSTWFNRDVPNFQCKSRSFLIPHVKIPCFCFVSKLGKTRSKRAGVREKTRKQHSYTYTLADKKTRKEHLWYWSDNSKHSLWLIGR